MYKKGCTCRNDPIKTPENSQNKIFIYFGDLCLLTQQGLQKQSILSYFACNSGDNCYCGQVAQFEEGNKYCNRNDYQNNYQNENFNGQQNKVKIDQQYLNNKIQEMKNQQIYGNAFEITQFNYECIYPDEVELEEDKDFVVFIKTKQNNQKNKFIWKIVRDIETCRPYVNNANIIL